MGTMKQSGEVNVADIKTSEEWQMNKINDYEEIKIMTITDTWTCDMGKMGIGHDTLSLPWVIRDQTSLLEKWRPNNGQRAKIGPSSNFYWPPEVDLKLLITPTSDLKQKTKL